MCVREGKESSVDQLAIRWLVAHRESAGACRCFSSISRHDPLPMQPTVYASATISDRWAALLWIPVNESKQIDIRNRVIIAIACLLCVQFARRNGPLMYGQLLCRFLINLVFVQSICFVHNSHHSQVIFRQIYSNTFFFFLFICIIFNSIIFLCLH